MTIAILSSKGSIVIPAELRRKYDLTPGTVVVVDYGGLIALVPALADPIEEALGLLKDAPSLSPALRYSR
jgi:AbrB family looped-hinge helix DNA binding protein